MPHFAAMTPWWQPFLAALGGALVGGGLTLLAGVINGRRDRQIARVNRVRELVVQYMDSIRGISHEISAMHVKDGTPDAADLKILRASQRRLYGTLDELRWLTPDSPIRSATRSAGNVLEEHAALFRAGKPSTAEIDAVDDHLELVMEELNEASARLYRLSVRKARRFLDGN